jgi:chromosome partitioning protein
MSKVIVLFNQSGGVGKSTLTMNLGYHLTLHSQKVLLVDMDPQGSLTTFMGLDVVELKQTVYESVVHGEPLPIHKNIHKMDLVPANINLSAAEMELVVAEMREVRLKDALEPVLSQYDFILIDCPPSLGVLSYISLIAATHVLVPIETQYKAFCGTELLLSTLSRIRQKANRRLKIAGFIPTRYDSRISQDDRTLQAIKEQLSGSGKVYPPIPRSTVFADASEKNIPVAMYSAKHPSLKVLNQIVQSLEELV